MKRKVLQKKGKQTFKTRKSYCENGMEIGAKIGVKIIKNVELGFFLSFPWKIEMETRPRNSRLIAIISVLARSRQSEP